MTLNENPTRPVRTWFITGASSGIGRELMTAALERGDHVAAVARDAAAITAPPLPGTLVPLSADVRDPAAVETAVRHAVHELGRIDVVANNAGYGLFGGVEEATDEQARAIFDTNVFGVLNVLRATLPVLRRQGSGHVLQGSSLYGQTSHAGVGLLAATKYAVEGLSDALAAELAPLGISVTIVEPQFVATSFLANLDVATPMAAYDGTVRAVQQALGELPAAAFSDATAVARAVLAAVDADVPPLRLAVGASGVHDIRGALTARLAELDEWAHLSATA